MPIDRDIWIHSFEKDGFPQWPCPSCQGGKLILNKKTLREEESAISIKAKGHDAWDPGWISGVFSAHLYCSNTQCKEKVVICGTYSSAERGFLEFYKVFEPDFIFPAPDIFSIHENYPDDIKSETRKAFSLFWIDRDAAGNRIRSIVEMLLDHLKVKKRELTKKRKYRKLSLHNRILEYHPKNPDIGEQLFAIKWLGNFGSHSNGLTKDDLLDDFEMIEFVLDKLFVKNRKRLSSMARRINRLRGPIR